MEWFGSPDPPPNGWQVIHASRRLARRIEGSLDASLEGLAISYAQFELLELLTRDRNAHAAALARRLDVSRQIASRLLGKLDRAGLVELLPPDGGVRVPIITADGTRRIQLAADATASVRGRIESVSAEERARLVAIVLDLDDVLRPTRQSWWLD